MGINISDFQKKWAFLTDKEVFIACSGGVDSMVLTHLLSSFCENITLLHVNYNLREKESIADENFVREFALISKLKVEVKSIDTNKILSEKGGNLQETARKVRFEWFDEKLKSEVSVLLLGHHEDDQIETFYQHLARKSGVLGLACMLEQNKNIMRPLLSYSKEEIYSFAKKNNLTWREDLSNKTNKYTRNKLRNEILPFLYKEIPSLKKSVLTLIQLFQENQAEIEKSVEKIIENIHKNGILELNVYRSLTVTQRIVVLKSINYNSKFLNELEKLSLSQKGKFIRNEKFKITKENDYFSITKNNSQFQIPELVIQKVNKLPITYSKDEVYLDASKIKRELKLRKWQIGDRMSPIGLNGSKLISDIISETKIPNSQKENVLVLTDEKEIHWCVGIKIGRLAMADNHTLEILKISIK
ncbi:MAG: tRNA lysidine(34) synthetase TilS [Flavobacteriia bacterium]|jgi:tRNA(Ile)-lysidine synthase